MLRRPRLARHWTNGRSLISSNTLYHLHFRHLPAGWGGDTVVNPFCQVLDEIASMIGMNTVISPVMDSKRRVIQMYCGDQRKYFQETLGFTARFIGRICRLRLMS